jgi:hypothetical protein
LIQRYRQSLESLEVAEEYYNKMTETNPSDDVTRWTADIEYAEKHRLEDRSAMDIMASRLSEMRRSAEKNEERDRDSPGDSWIDLGLSMEERQCVL